MEEKRSAGKVALSAVLFWVITLVGPFAIVLWNDLSLVKYDQGTLGYLLFATLVQGIAVAIAFYASSHVYGGAYYRVAFVCCIISATLFVVFTITQSQTTQGIISNVFAAVLSVIGAVYCSKDRR